MFQLVQQFGEHGQWEFAGRVFPVPSLIEDDLGERLFLTGNLIPRDAWEQSLSQSAQGVLRVIGGPVSWCSAKEFTAHRRTNLIAASYELPEEHWHHPVTLAENVDDISHLWAVDPAEVNPFVHLHTHSEYSQLDGLSTMEEICQAAADDGQVAVAVTDHGGCFGLPDLQLTAAEHGIKPIFGIETYLVEDRYLHEGPTNAYSHLVLLAQNQQGLSNLFALSTEAYKEGEHGKPRIDWDTLTRLNSGLIVTTACLGGPLAQPFAQGDTETAVRNLARLGDIFGRRMAIELHTNHLDDQIKYNQWVIGLAQQYGVPLIAAVDAHYAKPEHRLRHRAWMGLATAKDEDETNLFGGGEDYHMKTTSEVREALAYLPHEAVESAIVNTGKIAALCNAEIKTRKGMPRFSRPTPEHPDVVAHDAERLLQMCKDNWAERIDRYVPKSEQAPYIAQMRYEGQMIVDKGFPGYYLTTSEFVTWAKDNGILVGPGRGSGAASLVAYLCRIIEIDPIAGRLSVDRFMTPGRKSLPDFDIDFPSSRKAMMIDHVRERYGPEHVAQIGNHMRLGNKAAIEGVQRAIAARLDGDSFKSKVEINKLIDEAEASTAGLGLEWDDLWAQIGDQLQPYRDRYPEWFELAALFKGRLRTYSRHAAGLLIDPDIDLESELPMRSGDPGGPMVTQWDMTALERLGYVKYDFLNLRNLDTLQETLDLIKADTGRAVDVYSWHEEYEDPEIYDELSAGHTMGMFQIETSLGTRTTKLIGPRTRDELADVITLGRPGPMRSGLDKMYVRRRAGQEPVTYADPRLAEVLERTWGAMLYQEDIMAVCRILAGYDADEADNVRKILGKKKIELTRAEGQRFVARSVELGITKALADSLWEQMAEFARYSFNRAHAYAYATIVLWTAWFKVHYPRQFVTATMTTIDKERHAAFVGEALRLGYQVLPPDINVSGLGFTGHDLVIRYGISGLGGLGGVKAPAAIEGQPYTSFDDFLERRGSKCDMGAVKKLVRIGAFDSIEPNRRSLEMRLMDEESGVSTKCVHKDLTHMNAYGLPCHFDWDSLPLKLGRTGKPLKTQTERTPPKRCTVGCKKYTPPEPQDYSGVVPYTAEEIRDIESEMLGIYLSSSPFDRIPDTVRQQVLSAEDLSVAEYGTHPVLGIVHQARPDRQGRDFGFVSINTHNGAFDAIVYGRNWSQWTPMLVRGQMALMEVVKDDKDRYRVSVFEPI